jgi:2-hydroxycyclohexanecarboxyl-CoA dehydrogenase
VGWAICRHLARQVRCTAVVDLDADAAERAAEFLRSGGVEAVAHAVDVSVRPAVDEAFDAIRRRLGPIEIVVTSAATSGFVPFEGIDLDLWWHTLAVNLTGTFNCLQAAIPDMVAGGWGRIVTISSAAGQTGSARQVHYSASKGGVSALTKSIALEYASNGITANSISPYAVDSPMLHAAQEAKLLPSSETLARMVPARRLGTGDDIAALCAFLCSDAAGYLTGQVIGVNGGAVT